MIIDKSNVWNVEIIKIALKFKARSTILMIKYITNKIYNFL